MVQAIADRDGIETVHISGQDSDIIDNNTKSQSAFKAELKVFADKMLNENSGDITVFKEFTKWMGEKKLNIGSTDNNFFEITAKLMNIYETFFMALTSYLLPEKVVNIHSPKYIIEGENIQFLQAIANGPFDFEEPSDYYIVARMVKYLCIAKEPQKVDRPHKPGPQPAAWHTWPNSLLVYRTFSVINELIASMYANPNNPASAAVCHKFIKESAKEIYRIIGEPILTETDEVPTERVDKSSKVICLTIDQFIPEQIGKKKEIQDEDDELIDGQSEELERWISEVESYLIEHGDEITQLYECCKTEFIELIRLSKSVPDAYSPFHKELLGNRFCNFIVKGASQYSVLDISENVDRVHFLHKEVMNALGNTEKRLEDVYDFIEYITPIALAPVAIPNTAIGAIGLLVVLKFSRKNFLKLSKNSRISRMLSHDMWKNIEDYFSSPNRYLLEEVIRFYQSKRKIKKVLKQNRIFPDLKWLYTGMDTFEAAYKKSLKETHTAILAVHDYYKNSNIDLYFPDLHTNNPLYYNLIYSALRCCITPRTNISKLAGDIAACM